MPPTDPDHPNAARIREFYGHLANRDLGAVFEMIADDAVFHIGGDSVVAGEYRGKEAIASLGIKVFEETKESYRTELVSVLANDSHAVTLHRWTAERRGERIEMHNFNVYRFEDGRVVERWEFIEDQQRHDEFWRP